MIQLSKNYSLPDRLAEFIPVKVVSVGGAGLNALDRVVLDGLEKAGVVAINTDVQSLASSVAPHKDRKSTRLNSSHRCISYAVFCLKKKKKKHKAYETQPDQH